MTPQQVQKLIIDQQVALEAVDIAYKDYIATLDYARAISENLTAAIKDLASHPHLELQDFEIDG